MHSSFLHLYFHRVKKDQLRDEISKVIEQERVASNEHLARAIFRERASTEEERLKAQLLVSSSIF